ncbi:MAG: ATP-binding cassette domain-containing protein, partial [Bacteroidota bacterium]
MRQTLLSVENLEICFTNDHNPLKVVDNVSFKLADEDILGLVGESGCGKTITALSIMKLLPPNTAFSGRVMFKGQDLLTKDEKSLRR